jgi:hypothetical protein
MSSVDSAPSLDGREEWISRNKQLLSNVLLCATRSYACSEQDTILGELETYLRVQTGSEYVVDRTSWRDVQRRKDLMHHAFHMMRSLLIRFRVDPRRSFREVLTLLFERIQEMHQRSVQTREKRRFLQSLLDTSSDRSKRVKYEKEESGEVSRGSSVEESASASEDALWVWDEPHRTWLEEMQDDSQIRLDLRVLELVVGEWRMYKKYVQEIVPEREQHLTDYYFDYVRWNELADVPASFEQRKCTYATSSLLDTTKLYSEPLWQHVQRHHQGKRAPVDVFWAFLGIDGSSSYTPIDAWLLGSASDILRELEQYAQHKTEFGTKRMIESLVDTWTGAVIAKIEHETTTQRNTWLFHTLLERSAVCMRMLYRLQRHTLTTEHIWMFLYQEGTIAPSTLFQDTELFPLKKTFTVSSGTLSDMYMHWKDAKDQVEARSIFEQMEELPEVQSRTSRRAAPAISDADFKERLCTILNQLCTLYVRYILNTLSALYAPYMDYVLVYIQAFSTKNSIFEKSSHIHAWTTALKKFKTDLLELVASIDMLQTKRELMQQCALYHRLMQQRLKTHKQPKSLLEGTKELLRSAMAEPGCMELIVQFSTVPPRIESIWKSLVGHVCMDGKICTHILTDNPSNPLALSQARRVGYACDLLYNTIRPIPSYDAPSTPTYHLEMDKVLRFFLDIPYLPSTFPCPQFAQGTLQMTCKKFLALTVPDKFKEQIHAIQEIYHHEQMSKSKTAMVMRLQKYNLSELLADPPFLSLCVSPLKRIQNTDLSDIKVPAVRKLHTQLREKMEKEAKHCTIQHLMQTFIVHSLQRGRCTPP